MQTSAQPISRWLQGLRKDDVQAVYDAALDVAKGSITHPELLSIARLVLQEVESRHPEWT